MIETARDVREALHYVITTNSIVKAMIEDKFCESRCLLEFYEFGGYIELHCKSTSWAMDRIIYDVLLEDLVKFLNKIKE